MVSVMSSQFVGVPLLISLAILRNKKFVEEKKLKEDEMEEELADK